jgi:hypothetical protein
MFPSIVLRHYPGYLHKPEKGQMSYLVKCQFYLLGISIKRNQLVVIEQQNEKNGLQDPSLRQHSHAIYSESDMNKYSDKSLGCEILAQSRWFELTE